MLLFFRLGSYVRRPRRRRRLEDLAERFVGSSVLGFLDLFSGGSFKRLSLFALGIMPYVAASIILQLLTVVVPSLEKLQKERSRPAEDHAVHAVPDSWPGV